ncbi:MAG: hypothetical protein MUC50_24000, partial [Myxococcota bacterium]|nr:hypothetical protein [Myxococcota bacterium]
FAIKMPRRDQCGTDGCHSGRSSNAVEVDRGVETGIEGAGGPPVPATNIAFIRATLSIDLLLARYEIILRDEREDMETLGWIRMRFPTYW